MRKVVVIDQKSGRENEMPERQARAVVTLGRGRYITRDMVAQTESAAREDERPQVEPQKRKPGRPKKDAE